MVQLWSAVALFLCLTLPSVSCADAGESSYKNGHCPQPGQGVGSATEDDSQQMRCCSESGLMNGVAVHTFQYCTSPGCCGERGYLMCCNWDKFRVYLAVGLTLGTLAILGSCFGICTCLLRANGLSCADVCDICLDTYGDCQCFRKAQRRSVRSTDGTPRPWLEMSPSLSTDTGGASGRPSNTARAAYPSVDLAAPVATQPSRPQPHVPGRGFREEGPPRVRGSNYSVPRESAMTPPPSYEEVMSQTRY